MKAATYARYGPPDVVRIADVEKPAPKDNEVLLKVCAASVNPYDWHFLRGTPYFVRLSTGLGKPKNTQLGADVAGVVETVGASVTRIKPGDAVFGLGRGTFAEYACAPEASLAAMPANITFEQNASLLGRTLRSRKPLGPELRDRRRYVARRLRPRSIRPRPCHSERSGPTLFLPLRSCEAIGPRS